MRRVRVLATLLAAIGVVLLVPGNAAPTSTAGEVTVNVSAPTNVLLGGRFDYVITVAYNGDPPGLTPEYTLTDALPAQLLYLSVGLTNGECPTKPVPGQSGGTVSCTLRFAPNTKTSTIRITVETKSTGSIANTAQVAAGPAASATTSVDPLPSGSVTLSMTGPPTIALSTTAAPARIAYTINFGYTGPPINGTAVATFVDRLPDQMKNPGTDIVPPGEGLRDCTVDSPSAGGTVACSVVFTEDHRTRTILIGARPTGASGKATNVVESTGATASWTTTIEPPPADPEPPSSPTAPTPVAGPPAAPTATVADSFTKVGEAEPESVKISPTAETVQVALTWPTSGSSFDVTGVTLSSPTRTVAAVPSGAVKLRITKKRGARWLDVRIKGVHSGKLSFKIVAKRLHGRTRVVAKVRQSKR